MKELHAFMETASRRAQGVCQQCSGESVEGFCHHCDMFICENCMKLHKKLRVFAGHEVVMFQADVVKQGVHVAKPLRTCKDHDEQKRIYCFDCDRLICCDCFLGEHNGHKYHSIKTATSQCREALEKRLDSLKETRKIYSEATDQAKVMISEIEAQNSSNTKAVNQCIQGWVEIMQQYSSEQIIGMTHLTQGKINSLKDQIKRFQCASVMIHSLEEFCEHNLRNVADEEIVETHKRILSRLEDECSKHKDANLELAEISDIGVELPCNQGLIKSCLQSMSYFQLPSLSKCTVEIPVSSEVDKQFLVVINLITLDGIPCKKPQAVECKVSSLVGGSVVCIKGTQKKEGVYEVVYTPRIRGRHQLEVTMNGKQVTGSPFTMCVKIPPAQLGTPVRVISCQGVPYDVAFNSTEDVLVTTPKTIQVFDSHGEKLRSITGEFSNARGIAVDKEDNIFVADSGRNCVYKLDKDGTQLKVIGMRGNRYTEFNDPRGVAIIGEQVYVCDSGNHRIQVFTRELEFVKAIASGSGQFKNVYDVSQDEVGNLYVCDYTNNRIQVFNSEGEYLSYFQSRCPASVCAYDQFVYVSEIANRHVSVFDRSGCSVTSFASDIGSYGVRVNEDGFVYVCGGNSGYVKIF